MSVFVQQPDFTRSHLHSQVESDCSSQLNRFGQSVAVQERVSSNQSVQRFAQVCPLRMPMPGSCPFGGICHSCPVRVQAKLTVNQPDDEYKQEADRVVEQVMTMPEPRIQRACQSCEDETLQTKQHADQITPLVQRQGEPEEEDEPIQSKRNDGQSLQMTRGLDAQIQALKGGGEPLPQKMRDFFEPRMGTNLNSVRIHTGNAATKATQAVNAQAFTLGRNIVFGQGRYAPESQTGQRLLAHELTHVMQQSHMKTGGTRLQRTIGDGHDLRVGGRFSGDPELEAAFDNERIIRKPAEGEAVRKIQDALLDLGYQLPQFGVDSIFGSETERAVQAFQRDSGLAADGQVGPITMGALDARFPAGRTPVPPQVLPPSLSERDVLDPRIDVGAQSALRRLSRGSQAEREDAHAMLTAVRNENLRWIYGDDLWTVARLAWRLDRPRWELVPPGEYAAMVLVIDQDRQQQEPYGRPAIVFREHVRFRSDRLDSALRRAWAMTVPTPAGAPACRVNRIQVRKSGQGFRDFQARRGGGLDLGYHRGWHNGFWYANLRFVVDAEVSGDMNKCRYMQSREWRSSLGHSTGHVETTADLLIRPLRTNNWVRIDGNHVMWQDAPGMTSEGERTRRDLPYFLRSHFVQAVLGEDGQELRIVWDHDFGLNRDAEWAWRIDDLDVSATRP